MCFLLLEIDWLITADHGKFQLNIFVQMLTELGQKFWWSKDDIELENGVLKNFLSVITFKERIYVLFWPALLNWVALKTLLDIKIKQ